MLTVSKAREILSMKSSAFYKLKNKLGVKTSRGFMSDEDFGKMKVQHEIDLTMSAGKPRVWYRVSVNEGYGYFVRHAGLTKQKAYTLIYEYRRQGKCAIMRACG